MNERCVKNTEQSHRSVFFTPPPSARPCLACKARPCYNSCMSIRKIAFVQNENYHCYTRGTNKQDIFLDDSDYLRFMVLLMLCNNAENVRAASVMQKYAYKAKSLIFKNEKPESKIVDILAYSLMPNHVHFVVREKTEGGISRFMQKVFTSYSMYFNKKYNRTGTLFESKFKSKHIDNESYFNWIFSYVNLNPLSIIEPKWEEVGVISSPNRVRDFMNSYKWSSFTDHVNEKRAESAILSLGETPDFIKELANIDDLLEKYAENATDFI